MKSIRSAAMLAGLLTALVPVLRAGTAQPPVQEPGAAVGIVTGGPITTGPMGPALSKSAGELSLDAQDSGDDWRKDLEKAIKEGKEEAKKAQLESPAAKKEREAQVLKAKDTVVLAEIGDAHRGTPHLYQRTMEHPIWMGETWGHYHAGKGDKIVSWQGRTYIISTKGKALEDNAGHPWNAGMSQKDKDAIAEVFKGKDTNTEVSYRYAQGARYQFEGIYVAGILYIAYNNGSSGLPDQVWCDVVPDGKIAPGEKVVMKDYGEQVGKVYYIIGDGYVLTLRPERPSRMHGFRCDR